MDPYLSNNQYFNGKEGFVFFRGSSGVGQIAHDLCPEKIAVDGGIGDLFRCCWALGEVFETWMSAFSGLRFVLF